MGGGNRETQGPATHVDAWFTFDRLLGLVSGIVEEETAVATVICFVSRRPTWLRPRPFLLDINSVVLFVPRIA